jgi:HSP20 family protein
MLVRFQYPRFPEAVLENLFITDNAMGTSKFPAMDVAEHENEIVVVTELPGVKKDQVKVTFENGVLTIVGERAPHEIPQDVKVLLNEMRDRTFNRSIRLETDVDVEKISAELENGILRIVLPKAVEARVRTISVK